MVDENFAFDQLSERLGDSDCVVWFDLCGPNHQQLDELAQELSLDPNAVEDAVAHYERPKVTRYSSHKFVTVYSAALDADTGNLSLARVSAFVMHNTLVTVRPDDRFDMRPVLARWDDNADLIKHGVGALVHGLLDEVVDGHFTVVQSIDDALESLEDELFDGSPQDRQMQRRSYQLRKSLVALRRIVLPMREVVGTLSRRDDSQTQHDPALIPFFDDLYDHVLRVTEWTESLRDMVTTIFETNLSLADARMNTVMKKLTSWAAIIAVPTAVTGFFGQNVPYPGFGHPIGFWASTVIIVVLIVGLYVGFKRRDWL